MRNIKLRLDRYFMALGQERSFSRAAVRLKISLPAVTHQMQKDLGGWPLNHKTRI
jgi:DNA-binding transcriptional LysR family regulator